MKDLIIVLALLSALFLHSCSGGDTSKSSAIIPKDSLMYKGKAIFLESVDSSDFAKLPPADFHLNLSFDSIEKIDDTSNVYREDTILVLKFANGHSARLISTPNSSDDSKILLYTYIREIKIRNSYFVANSFYEGGDCSLWNKTTGKETRVWGYPLVSPDGKTFVCYNLDLIGHFTTNGFQVFTVNEGKAELRWTEEIPEWGPAECRWKDDHTIYFKADYLDSVDVSIKYLSLRLPEFR
jgi:hypothetical protein